MSIIVFYIYLTSGVLLLASTILGIKGTAGVEVCMKCKVQGKTMAEWTTTYRKRLYAQGNTDVYDDPKTINDANTKYYATIEKFDRRSIAEMKKYTNHVTHCTPCNTDPSRDYVSSRGTG